MHERKAIVSRGKHFIIFGQYFKENSVKVLIDKTPILSGRLTTDPGLGVAAASQVYFTGSSALIEVILDKGSNFKIINADDGKYIYITRDDANGNVNIFQSNERPINWVADL